MRSGIGRHRVQASHISLSVGTVENLDQSQKSEGPGGNSGYRWYVLMNRKFIVAILLVAAVPAFAQAQKPLATKDDAQKVVAIIKGDKAKTQTYCDMTKLGDRAGQ